MRKSVKAAWFLAAFLSAGLAAFPAMAAQGWAQENNTWVYYDSNGNKVYNEWKKGADGQWRYLNGEGCMTTNAWADSNYYVDSNGIMITDKWLKTTSDGGEEEWYYFGSTGKTLDDTWKKISDKWYHFDGNGRMEKGWILDDMYYTGDDGVMRTGWQKLYPPDNYEEDSNKVIPGAEGGSVDYGEDGQYWFYFGTSGKKYVPSDGNDNGDYGTRKIDGIYYCFNDEGILNVIFGGVIYGTSIVIALRGNASTGGTDFIALFVSNKTGKSIWSYVFFGNALMYCVYGVIFGWKYAGYSIIFQFISTHMISAFHHRYDLVTLQATTEKGPEVVSLYIKHFRHGISCVEAVGGYSGRKMYLLNTVISSYEITDAVHVMQEADEHVIINVLKTEQFVGHFYRAPME